VKWIMLVAILVLLILAPAGDDTYASMSISTLTIRVAALESEVTTLNAEVATLREDVDELIRAFAELTTTPSGGPPGDAFDVMDYGAAADGTTDDCAEITAAANAAVAAGGHVYFPPGTYRLAQQGSYYSLSCVPNAYYYAPTGVYWKHSEDIRPASGATIDGVEFEFVAGARAISDKYLGTKTTDFTVKNCAFVRDSLSGDYSHAFIVAYRGHDWLIHNNTMISPDGIVGTNRGNIVVAGGKRYTITDNVIQGGTTIILFMWSRSSNGGGLDSITEDCVVTGNTGSHNSEEGISFDLKANDGADVGALEYDTVAGVSGQDITLSALTWPNYVGYDIVFVDGDLRGRTRTITAQSGTGDKVFTVSGSLTGAAPGDHVTIGACYKGNYIAGNDMTALGTSTYAQIILYGLCFGNVVENNTINQGKIKVQSLNHCAIASASVTGTYGRAPCGYNTVENNGVQDRVYLEYYRLTGGTEAAFISEGNNVISNTADYIQSSYQYAYFYDNTGTESFTDTTEAETEFVYDGGE